MIRHMTSATKLIRTTARAENKLELIWVLPALFAAMSFGVPAPILEASSVMKLDESSWGVHSKMVSICRM
jgi:hypothetical protein